MASLALQVAGTAAFGPVGGAIGGLVGGFIDAALFAPDQEDTFGPRLNGLSVQQTGYGNILRRQHGVFRHAGSVIWAEPKKEVATRESVGGGKGGGGGAKHTSFTYTASFAVAFLDTQDRTFAGVRRIWADTELIFDASDSATTEEQYAKDTVVDGIRVYVGDESQKIDPYIEAVTPDSPAFRGTAYIFFEDLDLSEKFGNRIPNITAEWAEEGDSESAFLQWTHTDGQFSINIIGMVIDDGVIKTHGYVFDGSNDVPVMYRHDMNGDLVDYLYDPPELFHYKSSLEASGYGNEDSFSLIVNDFYGYYVTGITNSGAGLKLKSTSNLIPDFFFGTTSDSETDHIKGWCYHKSIVFVFWNKGVNRIMEVYDCANIGELSSFAPDLIASVDYSLLDIRDDEWFMNKTTYDGGGQNWTICADETALYLIHNNYGLPTASNDVFRHVFGANYTLGQAENIGGRGASTFCCADRGFIHMGDANSAWSLHKATTTISLTAIGLDQVVSELLQTAGYSASDYDVTDLAGDSVRGYLIDGQTSVRDDIQNLRRVYNFDLVEKDWKIVAIKRGNDSLVTIPYDDLAASNPGDRPVPLSIESQSEPELPRKLDFTYVSAASGYEQSTQSEGRQITESLLEQTISEAIVLTDEEGKQAVSRIFWQTWDGRFVFPDIRLPFKYAYLSPGDVVTLTAADGREHAVLLTEVEIQELTIRGKGISYNAESSVSEAVGAATPEYVRSLEYLGLGFFMHLDCPVLSESDARGFYAVASSITGTFSPYALYKSNDDGYSYNDVVSTFGVAGTVGVTTDTLSDSTPFVIDYVETVNVNTYGRSLSSVTELACLNGENRALIGVDGRWELVGFVNATLQVDGSYTLSGLIRGLQGTEWAMSLHGQTDVFVLLATSTINSIVTQSGDYNTPKHYLPVRDGEQLSEGVNYEITEQSVRLKPLAPVKLRGFYDAKANAWCSWERRNRYDAEMIDSSDIPMSESTENYEVDVYSGGSLVRTISSVASTNGSFVNVAGKTAFYSEADRVADGVTGAFEFRVQQISAVVGKGVDGVIDMLAPPAFAQVYDLTAETGYVSSWAIVAIETDGEHLFVMATDGVTSTTYKDFIKTYSIDGSGNLNEEYSLTLSANSGVLAQYNYYHGMYYKQGKLYAIHSGGVKTYSVDSNGQLTLAKSSYIRISSGFDLLNGAVLSKSGNKVFVTRTGGTHGIDTAMEFTVYAGQDHGDPVLTSEGRSKRRLVRTHPKYFYAADDSASTYNFFESSDGETLDNRQAKTASGVGDYFLYSPYRSRLYFSSASDLASADGFFPLDADGSWDGDPVVFDAPEDWSGRVDQFGPFGKHVVSVSGYTYKFNIDSDTVERYS